MSDLQANKGTKYYFNTRLMPGISSPLVISYVFDRTRTLLDVPDITPIRPIGKITTPKGLSDICDSRAEQIVFSAGGRPIYVFWSGGIDSTAALVSLLKQTGATIVVVMNKESIKEYPYFYTRFVKNKLTTKMVDHATIYGIPKSIDTYLADGIVVTGELGDQIFGADRIFKTSLTNPNLLMQPWQDTFTDKTLVDKYVEFAEACPFKLKTYKEFWWWINYSLKYTYVCFRMLRTSYTFKFDQNMFHFFDTEHFNDWAISTPMEVKFFGVDGKKYKQPLKDYIFKFTNDVEYQQHKTKQDSLQSVHPGINTFENLVKWYAYDVNGQFYK